MLSDNLENNEAKLLHSKLQEPTFKNLGSENKQNVTTIRLFFYPRAHRATISRGAVSVLYSGGLQFNLSDGVTRF